MWFKLLIIFQLQLLLQLAKLFFSYSYSYQYFPVTLTAEHQSVPKQRPVYIRTLYTHNRKQAQAAVRQETTERLR